MLDREKREIGGMWDRDKRDTVGVIWELRQDKVEDL